MPMQVTLGQALVQGGGVFVNMVQRALEAGRPVDEVLKGLNFCLTRLGLQGLQREAPTAQALWRVQDVMRGIRVKSAAVTPSDWEALAGALGPIPRQEMALAVRTTMQKGGLLCTHPSATATSSVTETMRRSLLDFVVLPARPTDVAPVRALEDTVWATEALRREWGSKGLGFGEFDRLASRFPEGILVTPGPEEGQVLGFVAAERISLKRLQERMPSRHHSPAEWDNPDGDTLCIVSHAVSPEAQGKGTFRLLIETLKERARILQKQVAVICGKEDPLLQGADGAEGVWGRYGFRFGSSDPSWGPVLGKKATDAELWIY